MPFFIRKGAKQESRKESEPKKLVKKRNKDDGKKAAAPKKQKIETADLNEEITSESDEGEVEGGVAWQEDTLETAQEKRLRLAKKYLEQLKAEESVKKEDEEEDEIDSREAVSRRIKNEILEQAGKLQKNIAEQYIPPSDDAVHILRGHKLSITCLVTSPDDLHVFSGSKDGAIGKWNLKTMKKEKIIPGAKKGTEETNIGHTGHVLSIAISTDKKYLVSGDSVKFIYVWNPETMEKIGRLLGHNQAVSGLAFRKNSHQMFSCSHDKILKVWNVGEMAFVENLFGHEEAVAGVDSLTRERVISCGGRDRSVRIWKIIEESQLVFHAPVGSIDCVALINEEHFVTGSDDNSLSLWGTQKKKPLVTVRPAHTGTGMEGHEADVDPNTDTERWITTVTSLQHTNLVASGCRDGEVKLWQCGSDFKSLLPLFTVPVVGFVNSLRFTTDGLRLVAGVGQEHRMGRWWRFAHARNSIAVIDLQRREADPADKRKHSSKSQLKSDTKRLPGLNT